MGYGQDDLKIWHEFIDLLMKGEMSIEKIEPHEEFSEEFKKMLLGFLEIARKEALPEDWGKDPEVIIRDGRIHYIIPLTTQDQKIPYCFTFLTRDSDWYFHHLESIFIRLDTISVLPTTRFPDISEEQKVWAREETFWSFVVLNVYLPVAREKGKEYALNLLKDGGGYFVGAKTWVPFSPPHKAFIQYLCWEQANLRGNHVVLLTLTDNESIVRLQTHFFGLYRVASHLKPVISYDDYRAIFETIWHDRAEKAGWNLEIEYPGDEVVEFYFSREL